MKDEHKEQLKEFLKKNWYWYVLFALLFGLITYLVYLTGFSDGASAGYELCKSESLELVYDQFFN